MGRRLQAPPVLDSPDPGSSARAFGRLSISDLHQEESRSDILVLEYRLCSLNETSVSGHDRGAIRTHRNVLGVAPDVRHLFGAPALSFRLIPEHIQDSTAGPYPQKQGLSFVGAAAWGESEVLIAGHVGTTLPDDLPDLHQVAITLYVT